MQIINFHQRQQIAQKVKNLMEEKGTKKSKLGEILGTSKDATRQAKADKVKRFLSGEQSISVEELSAVAVFFGVKLSYFLRDEDGEIPEKVFTLCEPEEKYKEEQNFSEKIISHTKMIQINQAVEQFSEIQINQHLEKIFHHYPKILKKDDLENLSLFAKKIILKVYYLFNN
jgi:transcriptional regulator with XRE-family HTH domain